MGFNNTKLLLLLETQQFFLPQPLIAIGQFILTIKRLNNGTYFTYLSEFFSPFIHNTQIGIIILYTFDLCYSRKNTTEEIHHLYNSVLTKDLKNLRRGIFSIN